MFTHRAFSYTSIDKYVVFSSTGLKEAYFIKVSWLQNEETLSWYGVWSKSTESSHYSVVIAVHVLLGQNVNVETVVAVKHIFMGFIDHFQ